VIAKSTAPVAVEATTSGSCVEDPALDAAAGLRCLVAHGQDVTTGYDSDEFVVAYMFASGRWHLEDRLMSGAYFTAKFC
jgi:hypothetical protein